MSFRAALDRIVQIESGLSIADPVILSVKRAYKFVPPQHVALPDLPAVMNEWTMTEIQAVPINGRTLLYQVRVQFMAAKATIEDDRSADIATAFWEAALDAFGQDFSLGDRVWVSTLRGDQPTLGVLTRAGEAYIGWSGLLDVTIREAFAWS